MKEQIDELARDIYSIFRSETMSRAMASMLIEKGWRKQIEGDWEMVKFPLTKCSICENVRNCKIDIGWNFCPNCGAKMKGTNNE